MKIPSSGIRIDEASFPMKAIAGLAYMPLCGCGCGQEVRKPSQCFIYAHNTHSGLFKGHTHSSKSNESNRLSHLGRQASSDERRHMSESHKGKPNNGQFKAGHSPSNKGIEGQEAWNKGRTGIYAPETLAKMRTAHLGKIPANKGIAATAEQKLRNKISHLEQIPWNKGKTDCYSPETILQMKASLKGRVVWNKGICGPASHMWKNGLSNEPYPLLFNNELKSSIRQRDGYKCRLCGVPQCECEQPLPVHHIDYDKNNCEPQNLITLCNGCHSETNYNREKWQGKFVAMMKEF